MIIMPVKEGENIERALKKFKRKYERIFSFRKNYVPLKQRKTSKNSFLRLQRSFTA